MGVATKKNVITLRVSSELLEKIGEAVKVRSDEDQAELLREALEIGLRKLEKVGYDPRKHAMDRLVDDDDESPLKSMDDPCEDDIRDAK